MPKYTVFDVETPNRANDRISAIGITVVEDGIITDEFFSFVDPETYFDRFNTQLTGISADTVRDAPTFGELWNTIRSYMDGGILAAHNAVFDLGVLKKCLVDYGLSWKYSADYICTVNIGRKLLPGMKHSLDVVCGHYGIELDHHKADSDSRACAEILLRYMETGADMSSFVRRYYFGGTKKR